MDLFASVPPSAPHQVPKPPLRLTHPWHRLAVVAVLGRRQGSQAATMRVKKLVMRTMRVKQLVIRTSQDLSSLLLLSPPDTAVHNDRIECVLYKSCRHFYCLCICRICTALTRVTAYMCTILTASVRVRIKEGRPADEVFPGPR